MSAAALWVLVILLGLQLGAGMYETLVIVPLWSSNPPSSIAVFFGQPLRPDPGRRLWIYLSPLTAIVSIANLGLAWFSAEPRRTWWLAGAACAVIVLAATFAYFVPAILALAKSANDPAAAAKARRWVALNWIRAALLVIAWLAVLKAFSLSA
ncbi:MAG TPA: DUF1772 domain-containing protein [Thermoanaerobaculia bacterium]|nr:DUF1772 domain-containing protein [Thermoanaerobaculia bacterium]